MRKSDTSGRKKSLWTGLCYQACVTNPHNCVTTMDKNVRLFFNRKKKATETAVDAIEIVVTLQRQRCYFYTGFSINISNGVINSKKVVNHSEASLLSHPDSR